MSEDNRSEHSKRISAAMKAYWKRRKARDKAYDSWQSLDVSPESFYDVEPDEATLLLRDTAPRRPSPKKP